MTQISNFTFDEITIGQSASYTKEVSERDVQMFAEISGDRNPVHLDHEFASATQFGERIAHGMLTGAFISAAIAMELPGPGSIYLGQTIRFTRPVKLGDTITINLEVTEKKEKREFVTLNCEAVNQEGKTVASGTAEVMAPKEKVTLEAPSLPTFSVSE
jgi:3-hydroxybutyryl-CoA dehydratase